MNTRTTLVLALVAAVVAGYLFFVQKPWEQPTAEDKKPESIAKALYDPKPKDIDKVELVGRGGKDKFTFKKQADNTWQMVDPIASPANDFEVNAIVDKFGDLKYVKEYGKADKERPGNEVSGLDKPEAVVKLYAGDKQQAELMVGRKPPTGTGTYVSKGGSDAIYQVNSDLSTTFNKRLDSLRNRNVVKFDLKDVTRVKVEGLQNYELSQSNNSWVVESPTRSRGDKEQIEKIVRPISTLYVQDWKEDQPIALRPYQLDKPRLKLTIDTTRQVPPKAKPGDANTKPADTQPSTENKAYVLLIGGATDPSATSYFAKLESAPWVFAVAESTVKELSTGVSDLRDKQIVKTDGIGEITRIEANTPGGNMTLVHTDKGQWTFADGTTADLGAVDDLVKTMQGLKATEFVTKDPLVSFDWTKPRGKIMVTRRGDVNPSSLLIGNPSASGQMVYVKNAAEDSVAAIRKAEAEQLLAPPVAYQDRLILTFPRDHANRIEITKAAGETVALAKTADKWSMVAPVKADADAENARNLLSDLSRLQAKRVVSSKDKAKYGLDKPRVKLAVYTEAPAPRPAAPSGAPAAAPSPTTRPGPAHAPAATQPLASKLAAQLNAMSTTKPAGPAPKTIPQQIADIEDLLKGQTRLRAEGKENPKATEMLQQQLAELKAKESTSQPAIKGAPQGPADAPAAASTQSAAEKKVYHLSISQQNGVTYAARDDKPLVYELDNRIFDDATAEMHDRQVLKFEVADVTQIGFEHDGGSIVLQKSGEDWKYTTDPVVPIDTQKVTELLNVFRDLKTHRYVAYKDANLSKLGLDKDVQHVRVALNTGVRLDVQLSKTGPVNDTDKSRYASLASDPKAAFLLKGDQAAKFAQKLEDFVKSTAAAAPPPGGGQPMPPPQGMPVQ